MTRRTFLVSPGAALNAAGANEQVVLGMIGVGNQGTGRLNEFLRMPDVRIAAICDLDRSHADRAAGLVEKAKRYRPQVLGDFRRLLELKDVDAVAIVTPDHWHAIPTLDPLTQRKMYSSKSPSAIP